MRTFKDRPILRKLEIVTLGGIVFALVLACVGFALYQHAHFRTTITSELTTLADTLGFNTAAALAFNDARTANEMLGALHAESHIVAAWLYDSRGNPFAEYRNDAGGQRFPRPPASLVGVHFDSGTVTLSRSVYLNGYSTGKIAIVSDLSELSSEFWQYLKIALLVLLVSAVAASLVYSRVVRIVTDPILRLSETAERISKLEDYSIRAEAYGNDETGVLVEAFNRMVEQIQQRDAALQEANNSLEERVRQRTAELEHEVLEREEAEEQMRRARDAAEVANRAKSEFLANMSHEIRTPLNGVMGMTDLALGTEVTGEQREYLETIRFSADSLLAVLNDILDFSKIEAGKIELEETGFDLRQCMEEALKTFAVPAAEKGLELLCDIAPEIPEQVRGDSNRLRQIIVNLVGNAVKFTHQGEVCLSVSLESEDEDSKLLRITVSDTGIGIPAEKQRSIFDPFTQVDASTTRKYGGTGLGLTISSRLVAMMGGRIWLESEEGRGTRFHFTVRLKSGAQTAAPLIDVLRGTRVLIVDDNATNRRILRGMLPQPEALVAEAEGGLEALAMLTAAKREGRPFSLMLTDASMPGMDGFELAASVQQAPELSATPVMMLTSLDQHIGIDRCKALGIRRYLLKPVRRSELLAAILDVLGRPPASRQGSSVAAAPCAPAGRPLRILLAEDNEVNQTIVVRIFEKTVHSLTIAGDGRSAVDLVESQQFDAVLMDVQMPEMDGLTVTRRIREWETGRGSHVPIIAMTAHALKGDRERCLEAGMDGYISKPIRPSDLLETIDRYVLRKETEVSIGAVPEPAPAAAGWDRERALEALNGDEQLLRDIVSVFLDDSPKTMEVLRGAIRSGDAPIVAKSAHMLKGSLGYIGLPAAFQKARALEQMGREDELSGAPEAFAILEAEIAALRSASTFASPVQDVCVVPAQEGERQCQAS